MTDVRIKRLRKLSRDYEKYTKTLIEERCRTIAHIRAVLKEEQVDTKHDRVQEGDLFTHIKSGDVVVASTLSDTTFRRYIKYPWGSPAGTVEDADLLNPALFTRSEKRVGNLG